MKPIGDAELLKKYSVQAPRYTSYPTAPHFYPVEPWLSQRWIAKISANMPISLYLHIPYCKKLCWFCGCHTKITEKYGPIEKYLSLLLREIRIVASHIGRRQPVSHIHFGGGSPTILTGDDFSRIMEMLKQNFNIMPGAEIAIEADPRGVSEAKIASYAKHGVNRISIGIQDFDASVQTAINRIQSFGSVYEAVNLSRNYGIEDISFDLVYGLPKQTLEGIRRNIDYALLFEPNRIALFGYAHVPWKKKNMRLINETELPDAAARYAMFKAASHQLENAGYIPIGLDHFARPGDSMVIALRNRTLKRNFQGYTTDASEVLIGLGASAISKFPEGYIQNVPEISDYETSILNGGLPVKRGFVLDAYDRLRSGIIESLMCYFVADVGQYCRNASIPVSAFADVFARLRDMEADGLVRINADIIEVTSRFAQAVRLVCAAFDPHFAPQAEQHAQIA